MYITAASTISYQPTFRNTGFSRHLKELDLLAELIIPDYNEFIPAMERRRMSHVQKMAIACSIDCLQQAEIEQPDAIIVGTSMGCSINTKNFLDKIFQTKEGPLSPTSFIVSTHNTIAGQIALRLNNHGYNMTYTQNSLSFEQSLIDAMLHINDGLHNVLVGAGDELEDTIYNMRARLNKEEIHLTCGTSFFVLSNITNNLPSVNLVDVGSFGMIKAFSENINSFLHTNSLLPKDVQLVLFAVSDQSEITELTSLFGSEKIIDYQKLAGTYYTNSAFAMHYALDLLSHAIPPVPGDSLSNILVCNHLIPENLGLILLNNKKG